MFRNLFNSYPNRTTWFLQKQYYNNVLIENITMKVILNYVNKMMMMMVMMMNTNK